MKAQDYVKAEEHTGPRPQKRARKTKTETKQGLRDHVDIPKKTAAVKQQSNVVKKEDGLKTEVTIETGVVTMSRSEKTPQALRPFNFLGLPAEVRNYIYDYVVEDSKNCPPPRIVDNAKKSAWGEELTINSKKKTRTQKETEAYRYRNFGLAQTSRQIRQEFGPLIHAVQPRVIKHDGHSSIPEPQPRLTRGTHRPLDHQQFFRVRGGHRHHPSNPSPRQVSRLPRAFPNETATQRPPTHTNSLLSRCRRAGKIIWFVDRHRLHARPPSHPPHRTKTQHPDHPDRNPSSPRLSAQASIQRQQGLHCRRPSQLHHRTAVP